MISLGGLHHDICLQVVQREPQRAQDVQTLLEGNVRPRPGASVKPYEHDPGLSGSAMPYVAHSRED